MSKKIKFGIISGAGPMAGSLLYRRVIEILQTKGAWRDADFPEILLLNVPFSEMLTGELNYNQVRSELLSALKLVSQSTNYIYIACQTLHAYLLQDEFTQYNIVNLLSLIKPILKNKKKARVVASKTSRLTNLHSKLLGMPCEYLEPTRAERAIDEILKGNLSGLEWLEELNEEQEIVLGCTEFSVDVERNNGCFIDPIQLAANDIVAKFTVC